MLPSCLKSYVVGCAKSVKFSCILSFSSLTAWNWENYLAGLTFRGKNPSWEWKSFPKRCIIFSKIYASSMYPLYEITQKRFNFSIKIKLQIDILLCTHKNPWQNSSIFQNNSIRNLAEKEEIFTPDIWENLSHCLVASLTNKSYMIWIHN